MQRVQGSARQVSADKEGSPRRGSRVTELLTLGVSGSVTLTCFPASWSIPPSFFGPSVWPGGFFAGGEATDVLRQFIPWALESGERGGKRKRAVTASESTTETEHCSTRPPTAAWRA